MSANKVTRLRFSCLDDIDILRQVLAENPFEDASRWRNIHKQVVECTKKDFSLRAVKEHLEYLLKLFIKEDKAALRKSGTQEQYEERERLLQEVYDLKKEFTQLCFSCVLSAAKANKVSKENGLELRNLAAGTYLEATPEVHNMDHESYCSEVTVRSDNAELPATPSTFVTTKTANFLPPLTIRKKIKYEAVNTDTLQFLKDRQKGEHYLKDRQLKLEEKRLELEERKIALQEKNFQLEKEKLQRWELEVVERQVHIRSMGAHQRLLSILLDKFAK